MREIVVNLGEPATLNPDLVNAWTEILAREIIHGARPLNADALILKMRRYKLLFRSIAANPVPMAEAVFAKLCAESDLAVKSTVVDSGPTRAALREKAAAMPDGLGEQHPLGWTPDEDEVAS